MMKLPVCDQERKGPAVHCFRRRTRHAITFIVGQSCLVQQITQAARVNLGQVCGKTQGSQKRISETLQLLQHSREPFTDRARCVRHRENARNQHTTAEVQQL
jgi:hypothetical protein